MILRCGGEEVRPSHQGRGLMYKGGKWCPDGHWAGLELEAGTLVKGGRSRGCELTPSQRLVSVSAVSH